MTDDRKKIGLKDLLKSGGFLIPTTPEEVENFERKNKVESEQTDDFDNPVNIIKRGFSNKNSLSWKIMVDTEQEEENLSMAARFGKDIPDDIRKKMKADRDDSKKGKN